MSVLAILPGTDAIVEGKANTGHILAPIVKSKGALGALLFSLTK